MPEEDAAALSFARFLEGGAGARQRRLVGTEEGMDRLVELVDAEVLGAR